MKTYEIQIKNSYSQWQGSRETYEVISYEEAAEWFAKQNFQDDDIPEILKEKISELEVN